MSRLCLAQVPDADELISRDPFALLIGMVLDQQIPLEKAFNGPFVLQQRLKKPYDADMIASMNPEKLEQLFATPPALHRFPVANAKRVQELARIIVDDYNGDAASIWTTAKTGDELLKRINALPGFGERKARIFVALLAKQLGVKPRGWQKAVAPFGNKGTTMSVADIIDAESLQRVRAWKKAQKAAANK